MAVRNGPSVKRKNNRDCFVSKSPDAVALKNTPIVTKFPSCVSHLLKRVRKRLEVIDDFKCFYVFFFFWENKLTRLVPHFLTCFDAPLTLAKSPP